MTEDSSVGLQVMARVGYAARAVVYIIVGGFAIAAAVNGGGETPGTRGVLRKTLSQPMGEVFLALLAVGLLAFAAWRFAQAVLDADRRGADAKAIGVRAALLLSGLANAALAVFAVGLLCGWNKEDDSGWTAWLLSQPLGLSLLGAAGIAVLGTGLAMVYKGVTVDFARRLDMDLQDLRWAAPVGRFGLVARGAVFVLMGGLLVLGAARADPKAAKGLDSALSVLHAQPYGPWLLGVAAVGLLAFGAYCMIESVYRHIAYEMAFPAVRLNSAGRP